MSLPYDVNMKILADHDRAVKTLQEQIPLLIQELEQWREVGRAILQTEHDEDMQYVVAVVDNLFPKIRRLLEKSHDPS